MPRKTKGVSPKIGIDLHTLEGLHQGSRTHCLELFSRVLSRLPEMDFVFFVDTNKWSNESAQVFSAPNAIIGHMPRSSPLVRLLFQFPALVRRYDIDLLHTQYICPPFLNAKTAVTIHDILFEDFPQYFKPFFRLRSKVLFRLSAIKSAMVFTVSDYSKNKLMVNYHVAAKKLSTIYNGADIERFFPGDAGADQVKKLGLVPGKYLLTVGRLEPRKNHLGLLKAIALMPQPRPKLAIVGQRDFNFEDIFKLRDILGLEKDVLFLEGADDGILAALYRNAKLFVYPTFAEGFGMPIIEAMSSGVPVISSNTTSLPEIAGNAAILINPGSEISIRDALTELLSNEEMASQMRMKGLQRAREFSWDKPADVLAATYRSYFAEEKGDD